MCRGLNAKDKPRQIMEATLPQLDNYFPFSQSQTADCGVISILLIFLTHFL